MKKLFSIIILVALFFIAKPVFGAVVINEIMYDMETGSDSGREWVEIFNNNDASIDLTGWKFFENNTNHGLTVTQGSAILSPNGYAIIADDPSKFLIDNPSFSGTIFDSAFSLSNSGENLAIKNNELLIIDEITYNSTQGANGNGQSLQKDNSTWRTGAPTPGTLNNFSVAPENSSSDSTDSSSSTQTGQPPTSANMPPIADAGDNIIGFVNQEIKFDGTKSSDPEDDELHYEWNMGDGKLIEKDSFTYTYAYPGTYMVTLMIYDGRNYAFDTVTVKIQQAQITINEFLPNPTGKDEEEEWIEVYNGSDFITDISGWELTDSASSSKPFTFPQNTLIAPKSYLVFSRQITKITLNNDQDSVKLLLPGGVVFQEIKYEKPLLGKSSARTDEGFVWSEPTPGMANISTIAINSNKQTISQADIVEPQITKNSTKTYSINLTDNKIEGGYIVMKSDSSTYAKASVDELASVKQSSQNPINLVLLIICIVSVSGLIGLSLIKFRKKSFSP